jgi:hypothetical protein
LEESDRVGVILSKAHEGACLVNNIVRGEQPGPSRLKPIEQVPGVRVMAVTLVQECQKASAIKKRAHQRFLAP